MFVWEKLGRIFNPFDIAEKSWLKEFAQAPSVVIFDNFVRVYFSCRPAADRTGKYVSYSAYVDLNRKNLHEVIEVSEKPILNLGKLGTFDEFGTYPVSVIKDKNEMIAYYGGWTRCESVPFNVAIGVAKSSDGGKTFDKLGDGPVLSYSIDEPFILSGPKIRKFNSKYYLFYIAGSKWVDDNGKPEPVYKIRVATSNDGFIWEKFNKNLVTNVLEENEAQASPDVFYYQGLYHMFFCYRFSTNYRSKDFGYRIGYASSHDLTTWTRNDERAGLNISEEGWDSQMVSYPHVFELDGELYMFYLGNEVGRYGFGLAKMISYQR